MVGGIQVPAIPLFEVPGNEGGTLPWQRGPICVNVGTVGEVTVRVCVPIFEHPVTGSV